MISIYEGTKFYYTDRNNKEAVQCEIIKVRHSLPPEIIAKREDTGEMIRCYDGFGCYTLNQYDEAFADAQIEEDRIIY